MVNMSRECIKYYLHSRTEKTMPIPKKLIRKLILILKAKKCGKIIKQQYSYEVDVCNEIKSNLYFNTNDEYSNNCSDLYIKLKQYGCLVLLKLFFKNSTPIKKKILTYPSKPLIYRMRIRSPFTQVQILVALIFFCIFS